jgi:phosphatidate cytidylyltransferase
VSNLLTRAITGLFFVSVLIGAILWGEYALAVLMGITTFLGLLEFYKITADEELEVQKIYGVFLGMASYLLVCLVALDILPLNILVLVMPLITLSFVIELYRKKNKPFTNLSYKLLGLLYISLPLAFLTCFGFLNLQDEYTYEPVLGFFILIWMNDTMAYLTGMTIGKRLLFERISPKKTWEGTIGGALFTLLIAYVLSSYFLSIILVDWLFMASVIVTFGSLGDLIESMLKRSLQIKDSGNILPGHGGILDRFDAVFISSPIITSYLVMVYG